MDYKNTLNLPRTDFAMKADLVTREPERLKKWQAANLYANIQAAREGAEKFILHDGPPFANGDVHIGTALNKILKDIILKYKTLRGFHAPYVPGWDCHGLPIEFKVSQEMRKQRAASVTPADQTSNEAGTSGKMPEAPFENAAAIRRACDTYARKYIDLQREQFKRLGVLGDWENPYLTLNKEYEADELRLFADLVEKGFVYRGKKPVYWSIPCRTALAEAEVEYADHVSQSVYVKFPVVGREKTFIVIWTTTPWTLPANLAVAYNKDFRYVNVRVGEENFIVFSGLLPVVAQKCGWTDYTETPFPTEQFAALEYQHPFCHRTGKAFAADFVTADTGTGFVHIAPGHGQDDYSLGLAAGLPIYSPVNDDGVFAHTGDLPVEQQMPAALLGKSILEKHGKSDANEAVLHELRQCHALLHQENYPHSYPHCWRSKTPIIFRAMDQWFIKIDHRVDKIWKPGRDGLPKGPFPGDSFRAAAIAEIGSVTWIPDWGVNRIKGAVESRPDWCISRQRSWGVPIPAFYDAQGNAILDAQIVRNVAGLIQQHGSNIWFEKTAAELWTLVKPANWSGPEAVAKASDTLDVWIDSGSSSRSVLMQRPELQHKVGQASRLPSERASASVPASEEWQADMYLEGSDQHRGWFQSSLLLSLAGNGAAPFKTVLTHGFMVDADREKISKSKSGGYEKPQTAEAYVKKWGADVVRLWVASQDFRNDIVVSEERVNKVGETYRAIRNALRYQLSNLYDFDPAKHIREFRDKLTLLDLGILNEFFKLEKEVMGAWNDFRESQNPEKHTEKQGAFDRYEFHAVYQKISQFVAVELSAFYHDAIKDRLYTDPANSPRRRATQIVLYRLVTGLCEMLSPILVFTTDEAWELIPKSSNPHCLILGVIPTQWDSVHKSKWVRHWEALRFDDPDASFKWEVAKYPDDSFKWEAAKKWREKLLPELEKARQAKIIGKALDAKIEMTLPQVQWQFSDKKSLKESLREMVNVSALEIKSSEAISEPSILVSKADGQKCERCWHWEEKTDIGRDAAHPTLCGRCVEAMKSFTA